MTTLMQVIKMVLDDLYGRIHIDEENDKDELIRKELTQLSTDYRRLTDETVEPMDYSNPVKRFAYIYKYTVAHADYIMQIIRDNEELKALLRRGEIDVACLGGGPGSDLLGIMKHMLAAGNTGDLTCYIFDRERAWGDSWSRVARRMDAKFRVFPTFQQMDVTDSGTWSSYEDYLQADLFTLSFFMSEVWKIRSKAEPFFSQCFSKAKSGAYFLFVDNNSSEFFGWFDYLASHNDVQVIEDRMCNLSFSNDEEKADLGVYFEKFDWPKRRSDAAYRIGRKR